MLKDDAIATLFDFNKDKQLSKCKTSCARLEIVNKKQLREEAFEHYDRWQNLETEINSKGVHTNQKMTSIGTQTDISRSVFSLITKDQSTQFNNTGESIFETEQDKGKEVEYSEHYSCNESDTGFLQPDSTDNMEEGKVQNEMNSSAFIVFWSSLLVLLSQCFTCFAKMKLIKKIRGSLLTVTIFCSNGHKNIWRSQP